MPRGFHLGLTFALIAGAAFSQTRRLQPENSLPPLRPIPLLGASPRPHFSPQRGQRSQGFYGLPYYPAAYSDSEAPTSGGLTIIQQFAPPPAVVSAEEPLPVAPQIREYPTPQAPAPAGEPATFAIVLKDGKTLSAAAVTAQGAALQIVDPDGGHQRVPLDSIDREATRRRNAERNLRLQLP
jgi:hypothetical protein